MESILNGKQIMDTRHQKSQRHHHYCAADTKFSRPSYTVKHPKNIPNFFHLLFTKQPFDSQVNFPGTRRDKQAFWRAIIYSSHLESRSSSLSVSTENYKLTSFSGVQVPRAGSKWDKKNQIRIEWSPTFWFQSPFPFLKI